MVNNKTALTGGFLFSSLLCRYGIGVSFSPLSKFVYFID